MAQAAHTGVFCGIILAPPSVAKKQRSLKATICNLVTIIKIATIAFIALVPDNVSRFAVQYRAAGNWRLSSPKVQ